MPIWVKLIFMLWAVTFVMFRLFRMWACDDKNIARMVVRDYPKWLVALGLLLIASIVSIIPLFVWILFFR
jgi:hypothetical protein